MLLPLPGLRDAGGLGSIPVAAPGTLNAALRAAGGLGPGLLQLYPIPPQSCSMSWQLIYTQQQLQRNTQELGSPWKVNPHPGPQSLRRPSSQQVVGCMGLSCGHPTAPVDGSGHRLSLSD